MLKYIALRAIHPMSVSFPSYMPGTFSKSIFSIKSSSIHLNYRLIRPLKYSKSDCTDAVGFPLFATAASFSLRCKLLDVSGFD
jgi:hypothetical protein